MLLDHTIPRQNATTPNVVTLVQNSRVETEIGMRNEELGFREMDNLCNIGCNAAK